MVSEESLLWLEAFPGSTFAQAAAEIRRLRAEVEALRKGPSVEEVSQIISFEVTRCFVRHQDASLHQAQRAMDNAAERVLLALGRDAR